ncbi:MAG: LPXTG cell wall anchor domain-containing protein, partial [Faecousia sp.]
TAKDYFFENGVYGYKLRGIFCDGLIEDTTGLTKYVDYYVYNGNAYRIDSAVELTLVKDETYGYRIAAYTEKDYYLAQTEEMGDCIYVYNAETGSFSDVYYCIYSNSGDFGLEFVYEDGTYTKFDNQLCYAADQKVNWSVVQNGKSYYSYDCDNVYVSRTFEGKQIDTIAGSSGVISGGGEVWLWSTPCAEFKMDAPHCTVEVLQGLTDRSDGTYSYYQGDAIELRITPDAGYEVTEVASYLYDEYVVEGTYISASGTWVLHPDFIPSTILVTTVGTSLPTDGVIIESSEDSAAAVTVQVSGEEAEKVEGLTLVVEELEETVEEQTMSLVVKQLGAEEDGVYILDIHFENVDGEETKVNATMVVTVPVPEGWDPANVGVYYVNPETDEVVDMNAVVSEDGKAVTFTTNHFSYYALVQTTNETHTHSYGTEWNSNESNHWHQCACGEKADEAAHTLNWIIDKEATATGKGSKHQECAFCGYKGASVEIPATGNTSDTDSTTIPQTGDSSNMALWITLLAVSALGLGAVLFFGRKRRTIR